MMSNKEGSELDRPFAPVSIDARISKIFSLSLMLPPWDARG